MSGAHALAGAALAITSAEVALGGCSASGNAVAYVEDATDRATHGDAVSDAHTVMNDVAATQDAQAFDAFVSDRSADAWSSSADLDAPVDASTIVMAPHAPPTLAATGLFTDLDRNGTLRLATRVQPFQP